MSAVAERVRRSTAGRRMINLVGKAQEEDDTFWTHDTWGDDDEDSGNDSFRESDEESQQRVDTFDSDFDDSESDREDEEKAAGDDEERELQKQEKQNRKRGGGSYVDIQKAGRELLQKKQGTSRKRKKSTRGDGDNAGLVLNFPGQPRPAALMQPLAAAVAVAPPVAVAQTQGSVQQLQLQQQSAKRKLKVTLASTRSRRSSPGTRTRPDNNRRQLRVNTQSAGTTVVKSAAKNNNGKAQLATSTLKKNKTRFTQEQLLLEAATVTEPENLRWLLGRKRTQDSENLQYEKMQRRDASRGQKVVCKFHSRRGCFNTLTFPEMDAVPNILAKKHVAPKETKRTMCVITGKPARYRDPKTNSGYCDIAAFRELRRRHSAREPIDQRQMKEEIVGEDVKETNVSSPDNENGTKNGTKKGKVNGTVKHPPNVVEAQTIVLGMVKSVLKDSTEVGLSTSAVSWAKAQSNDLYTTSVQPMKVESTSTNAILQSVPLNSAVVPVVANKSSPKSLSKQPNKIPPKSSLLAEQVASTNTATTNTNSLNVQSRENCSLSSAAPHLAMPVQIAATLAQAVTKEAETLSTGEASKSLQQTSPVRNKSTLSARKKVASPTTTLMINNALQAYVKLHPTQN